MRTAMILEARVTHEKILQSSSRLLRRRTNKDVSDLANIMKRLILVRKIVYEYGKLD